MNAPKKIAFCFMSYKDIEQQNIWSTFFNTASPEHYSVYIHRADGVRTSWIPDAICIPTRPTAWGKYSLVEVELDLYTEAMKDSSNAICILLSGDTIPLYTFHSLYTKCIDLVGIVTYTPLLPATPRFVPPVFRGKPCTRLKAWQWKLLSRHIVEKVIAERTFIDRTFSGIPIADEHAIPVLLDALDVVKSLDTSYTVMYVDWINTTSGCNLEHHAKPVTFHEGELVENLYRKARKEGALFLRKICPHVSVSGSILSSD